MKLDYVPLLQVQRELHDIPPGVFTPRGLSPWAGMALALHDARSRPAMQPGSRNTMPDY
jgi:hypothetical protein